jgi:hypothetical protein
MESYDQIKKDIAEIVDVEMNRMLNSPGLRELVFTKAMLPPIAILSPS